MLRLFQNLKKRKAVQLYLLKGRPQLILRYGEPVYFTVKQVRSTLVALRLSLDFCEYAYSIYCSHEAYRDFQESQGDNSTKYRRLRSEVVDLCGRSGSTLLDSTDSRLLALNGLQFSGKFFTDVDSWSRGTDTGESDAMSSAGGLV